MSATPPSNMEMEVETQDVQMPSVDDVATAQPTAKRVKMDDPNAEPAQPEGANANANADVVPAQPEDVDVSQVNMEAKSVIPFPKDMPMENKYGDTEYYVREKYPEYYELVMRMLNDRKYDGVTVTGTPGIGKSVFMAYFFQRYSQENADAIINLYSFDKKSALKRFAIARKGIVIKSILYKPQGPVVIVDDPIELAKVENVEEAIWLMDGPPNTIPDDVRWVSFTSPNENWTKELDKNERCPEVYMPVWDLDELREAAVGLNRTELLQPIDAEQLRDFGVEDVTVVEGPIAVLNYRFAVFGGVPRVCFAANRTFATKAFEKLQSEVEALDMDAVVAALKGRKRPAQVHRLLHYEPVLGNCERATIQVGSTRFAHFLAKREEDILTNKQTEFETIVRDIPEMRAALGHMLETRTYKLLRASCMIEALKLRGEGVTTLKIEVTPQSSTDRLITNDFKLMSFDRSQPQLATPISKNLESINGFYWIPKDKNVDHRNFVVLFQVTASLIHPVKTRGCMKALKALKHWYDVQKSPATAAALVFVVPWWNKNKFKAQLITSKPALDGGSPVTAIARIGEATAAKLQELKIRTVADLRRFTTREKLSKTQWKLVIDAQKSLMEHESSGTAVGQGSPEERVLQQIPQYVWAI